MTIFLGLYVFEMDHRLIVLNQAKAAIDDSNFKPGYYDDLDNAAMVAKIIDTARTAEPNFDGLALRTSDVRLRFVDCLRHAKHKDLLVVWSWCDRPDEFADLKEFAYAAGAKRLLILGRHCEGISVVYDSAYKGQNEKPSGR